MHATAGRSGIGDEKMMEGILEKLRAKLVFDWDRPHHVELRGDLMLLDATKFGYLGYLTDEHSADEHTADTAGQTVFVDGGIAELFSSADFSLFLLRVATVAYQEKRRGGHATRDFYAFVDVNEEKELRIQLFGVDNGFSQELHRRTALYFAAHPPEQNLSAVGSVLLQLSEFVEIVRIAHTLQPKDCIVRDGSLDVFFEVFADGDVLLKQRPVFLCGLAKTNSLRTTTGHSVSLVLEKKSNIGAWHYPLTKRLFFVKLHAKAKQVFRCDVALPDYRIFAALAAHAADPVFLGYPYGLVEADRLARVSMTEAAFLRKNIKMKLGSDAANLDVLLGTSSTHDILDRMRF